MKRGEQKMLAIALCLQKQYCRAVLRIYFGYSFPLSDQAFYFNSASEGVGNEELQNLEESQKGKRFYKLQFQKG